MTAHRSSWCSVLSLVGPIVVLPLAIGIGFLAAHAKGWNTFSFAVVILYGVLGTAGSMVPAVLLGFAGIIRWERLRWMAWVAVVLWLAFVAGVCARIFR